MSPVVLWVLTILACVVVALTRLRLRQVSDNGVRRFSPLVLNVHTGVGALAAIAWTAGMLLENSYVSFAGLVGWWVTASAGIVLLLRWLPSGGRHSDGGHEDDWSQGPGLSVLAHVGLLVGTLVFTFAYAVGAA